MPVDPEAPGLTVEFVIALVNDGYVYLADVAAVASAKRATYWSS